MSSVSVIYCLMSTGTDFMNICIGTHSVSVTKWSSILWNDSTIFLLSEFFAISMSSDVTSMTEKPPCPYGSMTKLFLVNDICGTNDWVDVSTYAPFFFVLSQCMRLFAPLSDIAILILSSMGRSPVNICLFPMNASGRPRMIAKIICGI